MRKSILYFLLLVAFLGAACNFPTQQPARQYFQTITPALQPTLGPGELMPSQVPSQAALPTSTLTPGEPSQYASYSVQSGDTLAAVAAHFGVSPADIRSTGPLPTEGLLSNGQILLIPHQAADAPYDQPLLPDAEVVNSPCGRNFDTGSFLAGTAGKLKSYTQVIDSQALDAAAIVNRVAEETSVNPHLLLAFIELRSHWVLGDAAAPDATYPLELNISGYEGLYQELSLAAKLVNMGYYGWRQGKLINLPFPDSSSLRIAPTLNAGSVALQYLFARVYQHPEWENALYGPSGFLATYQSLFGDPNACASTLGPLFPDGLQAPTLELPFAPGEEWALTGGLHEDWNTGTPLGALDFAPITGEAHCAVSRAWVLASASGVVIRTASGLVQEALLDAGGNPTGWELLYLHVAEQDQVATGTQIHTDDRIGHPSCEGGQASGTNIHIARLYRGEWIGAGSPFPLVLSGWLALPGDLPYQSSLVKGTQVVTASPIAAPSSIIVR